MTRFEAITFCFAAALCCIGLLLSDAYYHANQDELRSEALQVLMTQYEGDNQ